MFATLRQRNFALLWFGGFISTMGDWLDGCWTSDTRAATSTKTTRTIAEGIRSC